MKEKILLEDSPKFFEQWSGDRRANLTKKLAYLSAGLCIFYIGFDSLNGAADYVPYYFVLLGGSVLCLTLLHFKKYTLAKVILILSGLSLLSVLSAWDPRDTGAFMFFLIAAMSSVALFGTDEKWAAIIVGTSTFMAFYTVYFTDFFQFESLVLSQEYIDNSFLVNFSVCLVIVVTIIYYIINISEKSEKGIRLAHDDLRKMTADLHNSRNQFKLAIQGSNAGIWDWDFKKNSFYFSPRAAEILGFEFEEIQGIPVEHIYAGCHPDDLAQFKNLVKAHLDKKGEFRIDCRFRHKTGEYIWLNDSGQAEWDEEGNVIRMVGSIIDINERKKAEKQVKSKNRMLQKANEELDRFVYSTSHDLRAPLTSLLGLINVATLTENEEERKRCIKMMTKRVEILDDFIQEITNYSRNSRTELTNESINLNELVHEVLHSLEYYPQRDQIQVSNNIPEDMFVSSDKSRLKITVNNLITNAIKYHDLHTKNPYIKISAKQQSQSLMLEVEDNGPGIVEKYQDKVFNMFYRASENSNGSGLGLYITKEVIEKLGGNISMTSKFGKGSKFVVVLPDQKLVRENDFQVA